MNSLFKRRLPAWGGVLLISLGAHFLMLVLSALLTGRSVSALYSDRLFQAGDAVRYLDIAINGYARTGKNAINLVFYPLYPLLTRLISLLTGLHAAAAGALVSTLCYAGSSILFFELARLESDERGAFTAVLLFALYPFSMFVLGVYSESLFLLLSIGCMLLIRKRRFLLSGVLGFFAALTRFQGMLLLVPAVCEIALARCGREKRAPRPGDCFVLLIPLGFICYLGLNLFLHGNPFQFLQFEAGEPWYQTARWIGENIRVQIGLAGEHPLLAGIIYLPQIALFFSSALILLWGVRRGEPLPYLFYGAAYLIFTYFSGWMISGGRYMLCCFPLFMVLSRLQSDGAKAACIFVEACLFFAYSLFYLLGYAIM